VRREVRGVGARGAGRAWDARREAQGVRREARGARGWGRVCFVCVYVCVYVCVCVCVCVCVGLFVRGQGRARQGGGERRAASARSATGRGDGDVHGGSVTAAAPVAAPRGGGGALSEADCPAQPAGNAPDERRAMRARRGRRGRRADTRVAGVDSTGEARRLAPAPEAAAVRAARQKSLSKAY